MAAIVAVLHGKQGTSLLIGEEMIKNNRSSEETSYFCGVADTRESPVFLIVGDISVRGYGAFC